MFVPTPDWGTGVRLPQTPEHSPRFVPTPEWGGGRFSRTPERSPRFAATPEWGARFMMPTPERDTGMMAKTPAERWSALTGTPDGKASRKEVILPASLKVFTTMNHIFLLAIQNRLYVRVSPFVLLFVSLVFLIQK
jgi:hypothetical protein